MAEFEIVCINKNDRYSPYERITHLGVMTSSGKEIHHQSDVIRFIEVDKHKFFVMANYKRVYLVVRVSASGNKYLKTENDGNEPNNLLSLPEC